LTLQPIQVPRTNIVGNVVQSNALITRTYLTNLKCLPRPPPKEPKRLHRVKSPWTIPKSLFKDYQPDHEVWMSFVI